MRRAVQSGAASAAPPASRLASAGNPSQGDPSGGVAATILGDRWFYEVQESIVRVIEEAGLTPASDPEQLKDAIMDLVGDGGTSNSDIDARIATWARDNNPIGTIPNNRIPSSIARDSELPDENLIPVAWATVSAAGSGPVTMNGEGFASGSYDTTGRSMTMTFDANVVSGSDYAVLATWVRSQPVTVPVRVESKTSAGFVLGVDSNTLTGIDIVVMDS